MTLRVPETSRLVASVDVVSVKVSLGVPSTEKTQLGRFKSVCANGFDLASITVTNTAHVYLAITVRWRYKEDVGRTEPLVYPGLKTGRQCMAIRHKPGVGQDSAHGAPVAYEAWHRGWLHDDDTCCISEVHVRIAEEPKGHARAGQTYAPVRVVVSQNYVAHVGICFYLEALRSEFVLCLDERSPQTAA